MRKTILIPILLGAFSSLKAFTPSHFEGSIDDSYISNRVLFFPDTHLLFPRKVRAGSDSGVTIFSPFGTRQVSDVLSPVEQAFDNNPNNDISSPSPMGAGGVFELSNTGLMPFEHSLTSCTVSSGFSANAYVNVSNGGTVDADLSWDEVPAAEAYQVNYMSPGLNSTTSVLVSPNVTIQNLRGGDIYSWRVRVQCDGVWSAWPSVYETFNTPEGISCEVTSGFSANAYVNVSNGGTVDADLSWDGVPVAEAYQVNYVAPGLNSISTVVTSPNVTIQNLRGDDTYSWRIRVRCGGLWSAWPSVYETFSTPEGVSCEVTSGFSANAYVNVSNGGTVDADLSWDGVPVAEAYQVNYVAPGLNSITTPIVTSPNVTIQNLRGDDTYSWRVRVQCDGVWSAWSSVYETFSTPGGLSCEVTSGFSANAYVNVSNGGTFDADLSWDGIPVAQAYQVNYLAPGLNSITTPVVTFPNVTIQNLQGGETYSWRVRVQCGGIWSAWPTVWQTFDTYDPLPPPPSELSISFLDAENVFLTWIDNSENEAGFSIERSTSATTGFVGISTTEMGINHYEDNGLTPNTTYYYRVQALNAAGASPYSEVVEVSTTQNVVANTALTHDPRHNGSITAIKWKYFGEDEEKLYTYHYDEASQLEAAQYATGLTSPTTGSWTTRQAGGFSVPGISYDRNGNITSLKRQADEEGVRTIDALSYAYAGGNQLVAVSDLTGWSGFADKHSTGNDYIYDDNGNLIKDENQGIDSIVYNHMDLPERIYKNTGEYILYSYDAAGIKLSEELYNAQGERTKRTDYLGEFIFENGELKQVHHEEGRIVPDATTGGFEYQYFLRDHLGNNRVVVSATPKTHTLTLNYEGEGDDQPLFQEVTIREDDRFDHTDMLDTTYTHAQILNANEGSRVGSVIALPVHAGDTLTASVFAKYVEITPDASNVVTSLAANLISAFTGSSGSMSEMGNGTINTNFGDGSLIGTTGFPLEDVNGPMAFLNVMFLTNEEVIDLEKDVTFAYKQLNAAATQRLDQPKNANFDELRIDNFVAPGQGYILVYLSNESTTFTEVYFDDLSIELSQHNVTQKDDYYPFGLSFNEYRRPELDKNEYLYQGKEALEGTDWYDFHARNYHAALGRFMSVDPVYNGPSGYVGMLNNPISTVDPDGQEPITIGVAIAIAAGVSAASYTASVALSDGGFNNWDWGQFGKQVFIGAASGAVTFGIGSYFNGVAEAAVSASKSTTLIEVGRIATHATFQGGLSAAQGGDFWSAFASGTAGSLVGLGTEGLKGTGGAIATIGSAMLLGGATSEFMGGDFWKGAAISGIVAGANHTAHRIGESFMEKANRKQCCKTMEEVSKDIQEGGIEVFKEYIRDPNYGPEFFSNSIDGWSTANSEAWFINDQLSFSLKAASWGHNFFPNPNFDELRHTIASFTMASKYGVFNASQFTDANEFLGFFMHDIPNLGSRLSGDSRWAFQFQDFQNNSAGFQLYTGYDLWKNGIIDDF